jgi:DNA topoisomerase VI subunit B
MQKKIHIANPHPEIKFARPAGRECVGRAGVYQKSEGFNYG